MKRIYLIVSLILAGLPSVFAVKYTVPTVIAKYDIGSPVYRIRKTVTQSDGSILNVMRTGADHLLYYITDDGMPVYPNSKGDYCYALFGEEGEIEAGTVIAHDSASRTPMEQRFAEAKLRDFLSFLKMRNVTRYGIGSKETASVPCLGDVRVPVVLAEFSDVSFQDGHDIDQFAKHFNASSYTDEGGPGSVRDYFIAQSDSAFRPTFDVVAKVKVSQSRRYYGANSGGSDIRARAYISEAVDSAIAHGTDFSPYKNANNEVFVVVIYPGHGEQVSGEAEQLWAAYYYSMSHTVSGLKITSGLVMDELADYGAGEMFDGIGTFCHEFSHALGLPDFYNTNGQTGIFGMDAWDIMDYGQFNNYTRTPVGYTAYEREFMGWMKIDTLENRKQIVSLSPLGGKNGTRAYRIPNQKDRSGNEYYLLENRQRSDWFLSLYGEGMLVMHVDYSPSAWSSNSVNNNASHQRMTIIPADNALTPLAQRSSYYKGDPFPGNTNNTELSSTTTPCDTAYIGNYMNIRLNNIHRDANRNIVFFYQCSGRLNSVDTISASSITSSGFTTSWSRVEDAEEYVLTLRQGNDIIRTDTLQTDSYTYSGLNLDTSYNVSIVAIGQDWLDSEARMVNVGGSIGDVNRDGVYNSADIVAIYNYIAYGESSGVEFFYADVNRDGVINSADATAVYNIVNGQ